MNITPQLEDYLSYFKTLQNDICKALETTDGLSVFKSDVWQRKEGGGGDSRVITNGAVFEKGGVNFSHVFGKMPDVLRNESRNADFFHATGVSIVIHTQNPFVPIIHMNVRYFEMRDEENGNVVDSWMGGGIDLSPAYPNETDVKFFHEYLKNICDAFDADYYPKFKTWCDNYFTIQHRNQMRGVGGIFFDHLREDENHSKAQIFEFVKAVGNAFAPVYCEIVERNKHKSFSEQNKQWQYIRRGYYTEFNLVYDRGTHFGLKTNGRIESILMSLPPMASWVYNFVPEENSEEQHALQFFQPKQWF